MTATRVVTIGETMALLTPSRIGSLAEAGPLRLGFGGSESNVAVGLARLGHAATWVGRVGDDVLGRMILHGLQAEHVDVSGAIVDPGASTGLMIREQRTALATSVHYVRTGSAGSRLRPSDIPRIRSSDHVHVTGITAALGGEAAAAIDHAMEAANAAGATVSLDVNYRAALWSRDQASAVLQPLAHRATMVFASTDEIDLVATAPTPEDAARALVADGCQTVILKRGANGATAWSVDSEIDLGGIPVPVVDPVGAGDAFVAGYIAAVLDGAAPIERLRSGILASAFAVTVPGDYEGMPAPADMGLMRDPVATVRR